MARPSAACNLCKPVSHTQASEAPPDQVLQDLAFWLAPRKSYLKVTSKPSQAPPHEVLQDGLLDGAHKTLQAGLGREEDLLVAQLLGGLR